MNETAKRRSGATTASLSGFGCIPNGLAFRLRHRYVSRDEFLSVEDAYEKICAQLVRMIDEPKKWLIRRRERKR